MKKLVLGSMAAAMLATPVIAADMPVKVMAPPPPVVYDWSGAYVGFNIGGTWYDVERTYPNPNLLDYNIKSSDEDGIYGFHAGAQGQWGQWVLGIEAGYAAGFKEMRSIEVIPPAANDISAYNKITNLFTIGPRLGFAWDRWMIYGTGGYAIATIKGQYIRTSTGLQISPTFHGQTWNDGWFAGGGFEYMVHKGALVDVVLGAEYQHFDVRSKNAFCVHPGCSPAEDDDFNHDARGDIVRARLTIKTQGYGWWGPM